MKNQYKLKEVATINRQSINKDFPFDTINYIDIASVEHGSITKISKLLKKEAPSRAKRLVQKNDIIYSTVRPNLKHYAFIKDNMPDNTVVSTGFATITANPLLADPRFLYYKLTLPNITDYLAKIAEHSVSTYPAVTSSDIENLQFTLPPLSEQKRIANILSSFDNKIEILKKENKILEDIAENIFKEWFVKYNFPNKDGKPYKDSGGKMIDSELGPIPEGWRVGKLGEIVGISSGKGLPKTKLKHNGKYPLLGANGEIGRTDDYLLEETIIYTGRVGTLGNIFMSNSPAWYSDNTLIISPKEYLLYYVFFVLQRQQLEKLDRGSTQPLITQTDLKNVLVIIPDNKILVSFHKTTNEQNDRINTSKRLLKILETMKTALLYKLLGQS